MKTSCEFEPWISEAAAELLDEARAARLSAHLPGCEICRAAHARIDRVLEDARVPMTSRDEAALARVSVGLQARSRREAKPDWLSRVSRLAERGLPVAAGLVAVLLVGHLFVNRAGPTRHRLGTGAVASRSTLVTGNAPGPEDAALNADDVASDTGTWMSGAAGDFIQLLPSAEQDTDDAAGSGLLAEVGPEDTSPLYDAVAFETGYEP